MTKTNQNTAHNPSAFVARFWRVRKGRAWLAVGGTVRRVQ